MVPLGEKFKHKSILLKKNLIVNCYYKCDLVNKKQINDIIIFWLIFQEFNL